MNKAKLIALFGESGSGKDTIQSWLSSHIAGTHKIISTTTRPPRDYEKEGKDYHFVSKEEFEQMIAQGMMLEYTSFNGWYYGTPFSALDRNRINIGIFNPAGIRNLLKSDTFVEVLPVWIQVDDKRRLYRSLDREYNPDCLEICRRFLTDAEDFKNIDFDYEIFSNNSNYTEGFYGFFNRPKVAEFTEGQK